MSAARPRVGYHASHEQFAPGELLRYVRLAEAAGFASGMCSDHFHPWSEREGQSGFAWSWLGAALQATSLPFGVVTVPGGWRYSPAILAQAAATLAEMFPGRFWIAPGSGEWLNEHVTGGKWPPKEVRNRRLREGVDIIRALWAGETVTHDGLVTVEEAKLYTRPKEPPLIVGAALSEETAEWMGGWADGLITVVGEREGMRKIVDAFRRGGGEGKPLYLQAQLSFAKTDEAALEGAWDQWRSVMFPSPVLADLEMPALFDAAGEHVRREDVKEKMRISSDPERHLEWLRGDVELGFTEINLHCVHRGEQERFIEVFGERVLPELMRG
ncbi:MAG TPA: TIGR03885 family FMN-dependent LLM class oxidoreductase [Longimicrobium sp.]